MKNVLTTLKRRLAPELCSQNELFKGVMKPSAVLAGMIAQHLLSKKLDYARNLQNRAYEVVEIGKYKLQWLEFTDKVPAGRYDVLYTHEKRTFLKYYHKREGYKNLVYSVSAMDARQFLRDECVEYYRRNGRFRAEPEMSGFAIKEPADVPFEDRDRKVIKDALIQALLMRQQSDLIEAEGKKQQAAVDAIEAWLGVGQSEGAIQPVAPL